MWIKPEQVVIKKNTAKDMYERYEHISCDILATLPNFPKDQKEKIHCTTFEPEKATKPASPILQTELLSEPRDPRKYPGQPDRTNSSISTR